MSEPKTEPAIEPEIVTLENAVASEEAAVEEEGDEGGEGEDTVATVNETSFDAVITRVLDASDVANKTASIAATSTEHLIDAVDELRASTVKARMHAVVVLGVTGFLMLAAVGVFTVMALQLQGRLDSADTTIMAVGKRVVSLNASIGTLKEMETVLEKFSERQAKQDKALEKMLPQMETGMAEVRKAVTDLAEKSAKPAPKAEADPRIAALQSQLKVLEPQLQAQARATAKLAEQVTAMQTNLAKINGVSRDVETLLKMEKQRVVVAPPPPAPAPAPVAAAVVEKEKTPPAPNYVRFPNPNAREPGKGRAANSAPPVTPSP